MKLRHNPEVSEKLLSAMNKEDWASARKISKEYDLYSNKGSVYKTPPESNVDFNKFNLVYYILKSPDGRKWYYTTPDPIAAYVDISVRTLQSMISKGGGVFVYTRTIFAGWTIERV